MRAVDLMRSHRMDVDNVHRSRDLVDEDEWTDPTEHLLELDGQDDHIVLADRRELQDVRVLVL